MLVEIPPFLRQADLEAKGISGWPMGLADRTHFHELDPLGHVNNTAYLQWLENARIVWLIANGLTQYRPTDRRFVVRNQSATYHREMGLGQPYIVTVRADAMRNTSFTLIYGVYSDGQLTAEGASVMVQMDTAGKAKQALDDKTRHFIEDEISRFTD